MSDFHFSRDLESTVEDSVVAWATNNGWIARFMKYRGRRGCRDVDFYGFGQIVMCEFKKQDGGELAPAQVRERGRMRDAGLTVHVIDKADDGISLLRGLMA